MPPLVVPWMPASFSVAVRRVVTSKAWASQVLAVPIQALVATVAPLKSRLPSSGPALPTNEYRVAFVTVAGSMVMPVNGT